MNGKFANSALRQPRKARTVLLRMAKDQARADRIDQLKQERPDLTWEAIADYVGVTVRGAQAWREHGAISYDNAKKLAELFEVEVMFIMRGDGYGPQATATQLDRIEQMLQDLLLREPGAATLPAPPDRLLRRGKAAAPKPPSHRRQKTA